MTIHKSVNPSLHPQEVRFSDIDLAPIFNPTPSQLSNR